MTEQPLHEVADVLYNCNVMLDNIIELIDKSHLITAYNRIQDVKKALDKKQYIIREIALKEEGEKEI